MQECKECHEIKPLSEFAKNRKMRLGVVRTCKECSKAYQKRYREINGEKTREGCRNAYQKYREKRLAYLQRPEVRERRRLAEANRRAIKRSLPYTLTADEVKSLFRFFDGRCPISDEVATELDHFIPLDTGRGGTFLENMVPLSRFMNRSKNAKNPFEWAKTLNEDEFMRFEVLVHYLAEINGMSYLDYKEYVYACFSNEK